MALVKQEISLDLVHGADTKVNNQIDNSFQKMINVTFDGDMTAKKAKGFDSLAFLPPGEIYSLLARRQNDLISLTDKGSYKYIEKEEQFKKISKYGSGKVDSNEAGGYCFHYSDNFKVVHDAVRLELSTLETTKFYTKDGVFLNEISVDYNESLAVGIFSVNFISFGDVIYSIKTQVQESPFNDHIVVKRYDYDPVLMEFVYSEGLFFDTLSTDKVYGTNAFCDGVNIYVAFNQTKSRLLKLDMVTLSVITQAEFTDVAGLRAFKIYDKDSSQLRAWQWGNQQRLKVINKVDLTVALDTVTFPSPYTPNADAVAIPLSDTEMELFAYVFTDDHGSIVGRTGNMVYFNGEYVVPMVISNGTYMTPFLYSVSRRVAMAVHDPGQYRQNTPTAILVEGGTSQDPQNINGRLHYSSFTPSGEGVECIFDPDARRETSYIEIEKELIISNSVPLLFDGKSVTEFGFLTTPSIFRVDILDKEPGGGELPADNGYMFAMNYEWEDALGNIYYSPTSAIYSGGDPVNGITIPEDKIVRIKYSVPFLSNKSDLVKINFYIKKRDTAFILAKSISRRFNNTYPFFIDLQQETRIHFFPNVSLSPVMPYQFGEIGPEFVSNSYALSLYADRVFRMSRDNPISLAYSQAKLAGSGFEFNDSFFYLDILDKRGINEDNLSGSIAMDGRLIIFKETSILYVVGSGPSRANTQDDFSAPQIIVSDVGCIEPRSIVLVPDGIMFKSKKGIYLLNRKLQAAYIGSNVEEFNDRTITSAVVLEDSNEVRFTTLEGEVLVFNYLSQAWSWTLDLKTISSCLFDSRHAILRDTGEVLIQSKDHYKIDGNAISQRIDSPWLRLNKIQGYQKAYYVRIVGYYKTKHRLKMNVFYDYELYSSEEYTIDPLAENQYNIEIKPSNESMEKGTAINGVYQMKIDLVRKNCQAVRIVITDEPIDAATNSGECFALSNITVSVGLKKGLAKIQASKSY